jgi:hypothetical protein
MKLSRSQFKLIIVLAAVFFVGLTFWRTPTLFAAFTLTRSPLVGTQADELNPYSDKGSHYEMTVGGEKVHIKKNAPEFTLEKWGGEETITVKRKGTFKSSERIGQTKVRSRWRHKDRYTFE